jgi:hypothetical protein
MAAVRPAGPEPMMATWSWLLFVILFLAVDLTPRNGVYFVLPA